MKENMRRFNPFSQVLLKDLAEPTSDNDGGTKMTTHNQVISHIDQCHQSVGVIMSESG